MISWSRATPTRSLDILLIEDDPDHAEIFERTLQNSALAASLRWERSLEEGRRAASIQAPDVIVLDLGLGETTGIETLEALDPARVAAPIVVLTATADLSISREAIAHGAQDYVWKFDLSPGSVARAIENSIERFALTRSLETANTSLEAFASAAAHDLRAPLRMITTAMSEIRAALVEGDSERARDWVECAEKTSVRLSDLIDQLLSFTRLGASAIDREPCALRPLIRQAIQHLAERIEDTRAEIEVAEELPMAFISPNLLRSVLENLLHDAITSVTEAPAIHISAHASDGECILTVEANGARAHQEAGGESSDARHREDPPESREQAGGLAICEQLLRAHGGRIWTESGPPFARRVRVAMPLHDPTQPLPAASAQSRP